MKGSQKQKKKNNKKKQTQGKPYFHTLLFLSSITVFLLLAAVFVIGKINNSQTMPLVSKPIEAAPYPQKAEGANPELSAQAAVVYEKNARVKVFEKNGATRFTPASTVKIMTALVALETFEKGDVLTANGVSNVVGSSMGLYEGERIQMEDLLYGLLLPSGNDAAYVFATNYPTGYEGFMNRMNEKAKELNMLHTRYIDPSGYSDANYTTPDDLARLATYALNNELFQRVVQTKRITVTDVSGAYTHDLQNLNRLLDYTDVFGIKTGFTNEAGQVLVTSVNTGGAEYIIVVMKSEDRFRDTQILMAEVARNINLLSF